MNSPYYRLLQRCERDRQGFGSQTKGSMYLFLLMHEMTQLQGYLACRLGQTF